MGLIELVQLCLFLAYCVWMCRCMCVYVLRATISAQMALLSCSLDTCMCYYHLELSWANKWLIDLLGPFYGAIAVPCVTRCRCRHCHGHRCVSGVWQWRRATLATPGEWQCKTALCGEWAKHFSNASCLFMLLLQFVYSILLFICGVMNV